MAASTLVFLKSPANLVFLRCLKDTKRSVKICRFSTCKALKQKEDVPKKFLGSPAAKISIGETIGINRPDPESKFRKLIILSSISIFLLYFCLLREENDLDALIAGNVGERSEEYELIDLKMKLAYCERNHLPTKNIKARIEEIVNKNAKPVFPK